MRHPAIRTRFSCRFQCPDPRLPDCPIFFSIFELVSRSVKSPLETSVLLPVRDGAETLGRALDGPDLVACETFFRRYAPFRCRDVAIALGDLVTGKGVDRHVEYYLGELAHAMRRR